MKGQLAIVLMVAMLIPSVSAAGTGPHSQFIGRSPGSYNRYDLTGYFN
ncbi:MAG: hypothetical protein M1515_01410 [Candidatus Thermoplasmatota archaeon]|nr:hypothetical protein [Candidatus Thermoplasmatota archaeon]